MDRTYYSKLLIKQYYNKTKAKNTVELLVGDNVDLYNNIISKINDTLNIDNAVGSQLDLIGQYLGISRYFDNVVLEQSSPDYPPNRADDDTYRIILKLYMVNYYSLNSVKAISDAVYNYLNNNIVFINGNDMSINYIVFGDVENNNLITIIENNKNILPAPAGVSVKYIIDVETKKIFGFNKKGLQPDFVAGFSNNEELTQGVFLNNNNFI